MTKDMTKIEDIQNLRKISTKQSPVYLLMAGLSLLVLGFTIFFASTKSVTLAEQQAFDFVNSLDDSLSPILRFFDALSSMVTVLVLSVGLLLSRRWKLSLEVFLAGFAAMALSTLIMLIVERGTPLEIIQDAQVRSAELLSFGFPSVNTAIAFAVVTTIGAFVTKRTSSILWLTAVMVAVSQLYIGSNLPYDVIAGAALGVLIGSVIRFAFGSPNFSRSEKHVREALSLAHINVAELKQPNVDARGSAPYFVTTEKGEKLFAKIITVENRLADFMFKLWRSFIYKDFEDETPYLSAKQAIEHEAYITMLAKSKGVEVPNIRYVISLNRDFAILTMDQLDGKSLDSVPKSQITDKLVKEIWKEVKTMHDAQIAHRDLRLANVFVESNGKPMLIDFSFGESFASDLRIKMDRVEMLVSFSLLIGAKRAVALAISVIGKNAVAEVAPYLQPDALAGSTTAAVKEKPQILDSIRKAITQETSMELKEVYDLKRLQITVGWVSATVLALAIWAFILTK